ncbi:MAG: SH3 domain-containing protein, partial [Clostridia bacterium]|nr:SH3 domain-containing protein [Clostridia bacterium]
LRSAPSKETGAVYQRVYSGATVTVLTPGDEWTQVRYGNTVGYMMTWFLK